MELVTHIDGVQYEMIASKDLHKIKEITVYIKNIEKIKQCARECPALNGLKKIIEQ